MEEEGEREGDVLPGRINCLLVYEWWMKKNLPSNLVLVILEDDLSGHGHRKRMRREITRVLLSWVNHRMQERERKNQSYSCLPASFLPLALGYSSSSVASFFGVLFHFRLLSQSVFISISLWTRPFL